MFLYLTGGEKILKGKTICPKCSHDYILDIPKNKERYKTICPKCNYQFFIKKSIDCKKLENECIWEEHGEPRKTILSSIKTRTNRPKIAGFILAGVFIIGLFSAITIQIDPDFFYHSTFDLVSNVFNDNLSNNYNLILTLIISIFSLFALIGSIASIKRMKLYILLIAAFISIFTIGFFFMGAILSIIAIILILFSREEFIDDKKGKNF
jgi:ribosomal protein S27AE